MNRERVLIFRMELKAIDGNRLDERKRMAAAAGHIAHAGRVRFTQRVSARGAEHSRAPFDDGTAAMFQLAVRRSMNTCVCERNFRKNERERESVSIHWIVPSNRAVVW